MTGSSSKQVQYCWQGITVTGSRAVGQITAVNKQAAEKLLIEQGVSLLRLKRQVYTRQSRKVLSAKQIVYFTRQLANLCQANLTVAQALTVIKKSQCDKSLVYLVQSVLQALTAGKSLFEALSSFADSFDGTYLSLVKAGEQSGALTQVLLQLADYQERALLLNSKIKKALYYPIGIAVIASLITMGLLVFVVPQFKQVFANFGAQLPVFSLVVIHLSTLFQHYGIYCGSLFVFLFIAYRSLIRRSICFKSKRDFYLLKMPLIRTWLKVAALARWSRLMATTVAAGVPLLTALQQASTCVNNNSFQKTMQQVIVAVNAGDLLNQALVGNIFFPHRVVELIAAGEHSGTLAVMLEKAAQLEQHSLEQMLDKVTQLIEPVTMLLLALLVGSIIIAMYLPIFQLGSMM